MMPIRHSPYWQAIADEWFGYYRRGIKVWAAYRFCDRYGRRLYIGESDAPHLRHDEHVDKIWWPQYLDGGSWEVCPARFDNEADALAYETRLIHTELPLYNIKHNGNNPYRIIPGPGAIHRGGVGAPLAIVLLLVTAGIAWSFVTSIKVTWGSLLWLGVVGGIVWLITRRRW